MKNKIKIVVIILLVSVVGYLGYKITSKLNHKKEVAQRIESMPNFSFYNLKGKMYTQKNLPDKPVVFVYFNSECEFCQAEVTKIQKHINNFKNVQLVFVSFQEVAKIKQFAKDYKLNNQKNIVFLEDRKGEFSTIFDVHSIPYIVVYGTDKKILQKFKGATKIDQILGVLH